MIKHLIYIFITLTCSNICLAQLPYFDIPGAVIRGIEKGTIRNLQRQNLKTSAVFTTLSGSALTEKLSRTRLIFNPSNAAFINYFEYDNMCNSYLNPFKKRKCKNKYNYLKNAHQKVLQLVGIPALNKVNQGVKEQIMQKYTHITNTILKELNLLKIQVEKDNFYTRLILK